MEQNNLLTGEDSEELPVPRFSVMTGVIGVLSYMLGPIPVIVVINFIAQAQFKKELITDPQLEFSEVFIEIARNPWTTVSILLAQSISFIIFLAITTRFKGSGNWIRDVGFKFSPRSPLYLFLGFLLQVVGIMMGAVFLKFLDGDTPQQEIVKVVKESRGLGFIVLMILVALVVPVIEEIAFRGVLQRSIAMRFAPWVAILVSSIIFAAIHLQDINAILGATQLLLVGLVCGILAMYRGRLDAAIFTHVGFNLATVMLILLIR